MNEHVVPTIGLEVHVQLATRTKMFSPAAYAPGAPPNAAVHAIDLGLPGTLPSPNAAAVRLAVRAALALDGDVQRRSQFARKHYFYPDMPKGYQITQYEEPYCRGGRVPLGDGRFCQLERIHMEEDAGKLVHADAGTLVDLDRAGAPLVEIVSKPELHSAEDAHAFLVRLREILRYSGVSDCDMELGTMRCDANVSVAPADGKLGVKVEIKNLNSFKMVQRAIDYEIRRQSAALLAGMRIAQETRLWNDEKGETRTMRSKEQAEDYRYFPDPDLPTVLLTEELVAEERRAVGELPAQRRERYARDFSLPPHDVEALTQDKDAGDWFERVVAHGADPKAASNWMMSEVLKAARESARPLDALPVTPRMLAELIAAVAAGSLTATTGRQAFLHMLAHGVGCNDAILALGLTRIADASALLPLVQRAIAELPAAAADVRAGKAKALDALKGHVMRATKGKADPQALEALLRDALSG
jgi:aspartyl-tRNA(Asn)/glutamyl-tRNA(Gln) amidotransferase subunit B